GTVASRQALVAQHAVAGAVPEPETAYPGVGAVLVVVEDQRRIGGTELNVRDPGPRHRDRLHLLTRRRVVDADVRREPLHLDSFVDVVRRIPGLVVGGYVLVVGGTVGGAFQRARVGCRHAEPGAVLRDVCEGRHLVFR